MKFSPLGEATLKLEEELRLNPYLDATGHWSVGWGHRLRATEPHTEKISLDRAKDYFKQDIYPIEALINHEVRVTLSQNEYDALVIFTFNIGQLAFHDSHVLRLINVGAAQSDIEKWWKAWHKGTVDGKPLQNVPGLVNRRAAEWNIFAKNDYGNQSA